MPPQRKYLLTLTNGTKHWVDSVNEELDAALIEHAEQNRTWYSYHMKPDVNKFSTIQYLGSAVGGFVFLTGSIYLGIMRKHSIPTDAIQAMEFAQSRADARKDAQVDVTLEDVGGLENIVEDLNEVIAFLKNPESFKRIGAKPPNGSGSSASVEDVDGFAGNADHVAAKRRREAAEHDLSALRTCTSAARGLSVPARAACSARTSARRYTHSATSAVAHAETTRNEMPGRPVLPAGTWGSARVVASPA